jgi:site-specific DNA-methyltransferase (adenine-specific)
MKWKLYEGDCLEVMPKLKDKSIDLIISDLPYGTTACKWDSIIPLEPLWEEYERIIKIKGAIVLTATQPFTSKLVSSNYDMFKYSWVWIKSNSTNFVHAKNKPMGKHEDILVFSEGVTIHKGQSKNRMNYYPQGLKEINIHKKANSHSDVNFTVRPSHGDYIKTHTNYPDTVLNFKSERGYHPTQKPVKLFEYLIKTYTNENDLVLDNCAGSGTTGVACYNTNRNCIMIEKEPEYCEIIKKRMGELTKQEKLI